MKPHRLGRWVTLPLSICLSLLATVQGAGHLHHPKYCTSEECRIVADNILRSQNRPVKPCDDFSKHVCKGQMGFHLFFTNEKIHGVITEMFKNIKPSDMEALKKAKTFHDTCMDVDVLAHRGLTPIKSILSDNGEWPITVPSDKWNNRTLVWQEMHKRFANRTGISALFDFTVDVDRNNSGVHILSLSVPTIPSKRTHLISQTNEESRSYDSYKNYFATVVEEFKKLRNLDVKQDDILVDSQEIIAFEDKLDKLATLLDEGGNEDADNVRFTTIGTLQNDWDAAVPRNSDYSINWLDTIRDRFEGTGIVIDATEKIALKPGTFVENFAHALVYTTVRTIVNYIHWKVVDNLMPLTISNIQNPHVISLLIAGSRAGDCIYRNKMTHAVGYMYAKEHLSVQSKKAAREIVENLKNEMKREITESSWLDETTKSVVRKKIETMKNIVGYPEWYDEPDKIDDYYGQLTVGPDYFENGLAYNKFEAMKKLSDLRSPVDPNEIKWKISWPHIVNAEYLPRSNAMSLPAAILTSPFFVYERPSVLNYGSIGSIVGHEIAHAFDTNGRFYDEAGIERKWWSQSMIDTYNTKAQCFVEQYNNYTAINENGKTVHVNGMKTQEENIADTIGFRAGLRAYQRLRKDGKTDNVKIQRLSNFTDEQLYFYQLAYVWCAPRDPYIESIDWHSPPRLRIIGSLSNMQEFADAFNCPSGSPMNPRKKCLIWD